LVVEEAVIRGRKVKFRTWTYGDLLEARRHSTKFTQTADKTEAQVDPWEFNVWLLVKTVVEWDLNIPITVDAIKNTDDPEIIEFFEEAISFAQKLNRITRAEQKK
jgi:hypothetical protein